MSKQQYKADDRIVIVGERGDKIETTKADFEASHYAENGYEIEGPAPDPAAPHEIPPTHENL